MIPCTDVTTYVGEPCTDASQSMVVAQPVQLDELQANVTARN